MNTTTSVNYDIDIKPKEREFLAFANGPPEWGYIPVPTALPPAAAYNVCSTASPPIKETMTRAVVSYTKCLRNHAASVGGHALDGCCEFMPSPDPTFLKCAACGCHRNFHRPDPDDPNPIRHHCPLFVPPPFSLSLLPRQPSPPSLPQQRRQPQAPAQEITTNNSAYFSSAHLAMSRNPSGVMTDQRPAVAGLASGNKNYNSGNSCGRKRYRTKFSQEQKEKMHEFSEKLGWRLNKIDEGLIREFCKEVGLGRTVLKSWMHNNRNTFPTKRVNYGGGGTENGNGNGGVDDNFAPINGNGFYSK